MNGLDPEVSIIVPCFNEEDNIEDCVRQLDLAFKPTGIAHEILLVNDGSTDQTLSRALSLAASFSSVRVVDMVENFGKAIALREGVRRSKGSILAFFDADLQYASKDLVAMVTTLSEGIDFVNGSRDYNGYGSSRTTFSRIYNKVVRLLFRMDLRDSNCGIKVLTRQAADNGSIFGYGLPLVVPLLRVRGFLSFEFPVTLHDRKKGESKYYHDGHFLGGTRNLQDITYHSIMLLNLIAHIPWESTRLKGPRLKSLPS